MSWLLTPFEMCPLICSISLLKRLVSCTKLLIQCVIVACVNINFSPLLPQSLSYFSFLIYLYPPSLPPAPGPPSNVQLIPMNSTTLMLSWVPPQQPNGVLTGYSYTCNQTSSPMDLLKGGSVGPIVLSVLITGLSPFTSYTCSVSASIALGDGVSVTVMNITSEAGNGMKFHIKCSCTSLQ